MTNAQFTMLAAFVRDLAIVFAVIVYAIDTL
jgi:hypothetical protein